MLKIMNPKNFINLFFSKLFKKSVKKTFNEIYENNYWNSSESISGPGSELKQTELLVSKLPNLFNEYDIKTILDLPCGDFKWMQSIDLSNYSYTGGDIVEDLIKTNIKNNLDQSNRKFIVIDLITDPIPTCDIIIVRDCLVHLSYDNINLAIKNIKSSGCKYILTTTFTDKDENKDIITGDWRPLNLERSPFNFPSPILIINENCTEVNGMYNDKSMGLWEINKL